MTVPRVRRVARVCAATDRCGRGSWRLGGEVARAGSAGSLAERAESEALAQARLRQRSGRSGKCRTRAGDAGSWSGLDLALVKPRRSRTARPRGCSAAVIAREDAGAVESANLRRFSECGSGRRFEEHDRDAACRPPLVVEISGCPVCHLRPEAFALGGCRLARHDVVCDAADSRGCSRLVLEV